MSLLPALRKGSDSVRLVHLCQFFFPTVNAKKIGLSLNWLELVLGPPLGVFPVTKEGNCRPKGGGFPLSSYTPTPLLRDAGAPEMPPSLSVCLPPQASSQPYPPARALVPSPVPPRAPAVLWLLGLSGTFSALWQQGVGARLPSALPSDH